MANRVLIGDVGSSAYGVKVSKPGVDVTTAASKDLLFDSTKQRHGVIHKTASSSSGFNFFLDQGVGTQPTVGSVAYTPLVIFIEKNYRTRFKKFPTSDGGQGNTAYYTIDSTYLNRISDGATTIIDSDDTIFDNHEFDAGGVQVERNYSSGGNLRLRGISVGFKAGAGEHGAKANRASAFTITTGLTMGFRAADGSITGATYAVTTGSSYTISADDESGVPVTNAKAAVLKIPCGYGFMNSTFMKF